MTADQVRAMVLEEIGDDWSRTNAHGVDIKRCLVTPRKTRCRNTFPKLNKGKPLDLWIVLEETPKQKSGYLIVFDEQKQVFGLADWGEDTPVFLGFHGSFFDALEGM